MLTLKHARTESSRSRRVNTQALTLTHVRERAAVLDHRSVFSQR